MSLLEKKIAQLSDKDKLWILQQLSGAERERLLKRIHLLTGQSIKSAMPVVFEPSLTLSPEAEKLLTYPVIFVAIMLIHGQFDCAYDIEQHHPDSLALQEAKEKAKLIKQDTAKQLISDFLAGLA